LPQCEIAAFAPIELSIVSSTDLIPGCVGPIPSISAFPSNPPSHLVEGFTNFEAVSSALEYNDSQTCQNTTPRGLGEVYSFHRIHVLFQRLKKEDVNLFQYRVKYRSGSSTLGVLDWSGVDGIAPSEDSKREDRVRVLHVSATDLGQRGVFFS